MNDDTENIPPFVQEYLDGLEYEGYGEFVKLSQEYHKEREDYPGKYAEQSTYLNDFNRRTGQNRKLNYEDGLNRIDADFKKKAYETAKKHGFKGSDPNQPSDTEFSKQGEKLHDIIDKTRQPKPEQEKPSQKQEVDNVEMLKEQQAYRQNSPKVEFTSGTDQENREQQRAAFLKQVKNTREQQVQQRLDKQAEI